jgi:hypothetical protein
MPSNRSKPIVRAMVVFGFLAIGSTADAQGWYYVNNQPVSADVARQMAARGLPFGNYWLQGNGNWGFANSSDAVGNVHGRRPSLSERGRLYSPGELLR